MILDSTEEQRAAILADMPAVLQHAFEYGEPVWTTEELREHFEVEGFLAPFVVVIRKSDGVRGTLMFTHRPRYYFNFEPA